MTYECRTGCGGCGEQFDEEELQTTEVREDWGDVVCWVCPRCGEIDFEGREMIVSVED